MHTAALSLSTTSQPILVCIEGKPQIEPSNYELANQVSLKKIDTIAVLPRHA